MLVYGNEIKNVNQRACRVQISALLLAFYWKMKSKNPNWDSAVNTYNHYVPGVHWPANWETVGVRLRDELAVHQPLVEDMVSSSKSAVQLQCHPFKEVSWSWKHLNLGTFDWNCSEDNGNTLVLFHADNNSDRKSPVVRGIKISALCSWTSSSLTVHRDMKTLLHNTVCFSIYRTYFCF